MESAALYTVWFWPVFFLASVQEAPLPRRTGERGAYGTGTYTFGGEI